MPKVTLVCKQCGKKARRELRNVPGCRGVHETPSEPALCPDGHGPMVREECRHQSKMVVSGELRCELPPGHAGVHKRRGVTWGVAS